MKSDRFIIPIIMLFCLTILGGMALKGLMYWWMPMLFAFLCMAIYAEREAEKEANAKPTPFPLDKSDYKASYVPPEEKDWTTTALSSNNCSKCNNEVYDVCMCKPVVNESDLEEPIW